MTSLNPDAYPKCNTHRKRLKFFCTKHELLLCSVCAVKRHRSCEEVLTLNEASEDKRNDGKKLLEVYNQRVALIENAITERKAAKKLLDSNAQEIQNEIHDVTQRLIDLVKHEERALLENLQGIQSRESEALDKDIGGLEVTYEKVKTRHETLTNNLKLTEADLIHAVIKEKQQAEDNNEVETIVKKSFREIDFKFIVSPHVTSFLKHFKTLGQVMLSEDSNNNSRGNISISLSSLNSIPPSPTPTSQRPDDNSIVVRPSRPNLEEPPLSARERWSRDRLAQLTQRNAMIQQDGQPSVSPSEAGNIFQYGQYTHNPEKRQLPLDRRQSSARAQQRPSTPEVYDRRRNVSQPRERRDFITRPVSTPPTQTSLYGSSPKSRDVDRHPQENPYRFVKAEPVNFSEQSAHSQSVRRPFKAPLDARGSQSDLHHSEPVHLYQYQRPTVQEYTASSPSEERPPSRTISPSNQTVSSEQGEDVNFGRTFAAVHVTDRQHTKTDVPSSKPLTQQARPGQYMNGTSRDRLFSEPPPYSYRRPNSRQSNGEPFFENSRQTLQSDSAATDEEKGRRWVHQTSFNSNGIGSKRLITGMGILSDGRIVVVDQEQYTVQLYDRNCTFLSELKLESRPFDVAVLGDAKIVVSLQTERVLKFILITGDALTAVADLGVPCDLVCYGVCRGGGHYCVCCADEIWILSDEGRVKNRIKHDKTGNILFVQAEYVCMDPAGNMLFVSDAGNNKIIAITIDGKRLWEFTYEGFKPSGVKFYEGFLYICDRDQHRVLMLNTSGQVVRQSVVGRLQNPQAISFSQSNNTFFVSQLRYDAIVSPQRPIHVYGLQ